MATRPAANADKPLTREEVRRLTELRLMPNLVKIPLFVGIMVWLNWLAWVTDVTVVRWAAYVGIGYMWMAMVTFMHDAGHFTLFRSRLANWTFGIICMMPLMVASLSWPA